MPSINLLPDAPEQELELELDLEPAPATASGAAADASCPGCLGKGKYVGFMAVEDPCRFCNGTGRADDVQF